jgi:hypothetical protein
MNRRVRCAVAGVVGVGAGSLLLAADWSVPLATCTAFVLVAILHGQGTSCPACGRWWSRVQVKKGLVAREVFDAKGVPSEKSVDQTTYRCSGCRYNWSVTDTEAYRDYGWGRSQPHGG